MSPSSLRRLYPVAVAALVVVLLVHVLGVFDFVGDDAYIAFRYADNLARHGQLVYNLGERVEGYTNFLWTVLLAGFIELHARPAIASRVLGALFSAAALVLTYLLVRRHRGGDPRPLDLLAPALCALTPAFACWSSGGLETPLFTALLLLGLWLYLGERLASAGLAFALAAMTRPEGVMVFALVAFHRAARRAIDTARLRRIPDGTARDLGLPAAFVLVFGAYFAWRWSYYGYFFPNTYYVKAQSGIAHMLPWGGRYLASFAIDAPVLAVAPLLGLLPIAGEPPALDGVSRRRFLTLLYLVLVPYVAYVACVGGDFMALHRFLAPMVPLAAILAGEGIRALGAPLRGASRRVVPAVAAIAVLGVTFVQAARADTTALADRWPPGDTLHAGIDPIGYLRDFAADRVVMGRWLRTHVVRTTSVVVGAAGALPYTSGLYTIDGLGLADLHVAHEPGPTGDRPGHQKAASLGYLLSRHPTLLCFGDGAYLGPANLAATPPENPAMWAARGYAWGCLHPDGTRLYYCCWHRTGVTIGPFVGGGDVPVPPRSGEAGPSLPPPHAARAIWP